MRRVFHRSRGFTLVELVLTITIIGVISFLALPKFFNQSTFDERFFYDDLLAASRYASKLAIGSGCAVRLSVSGSGYSLDQDSNCDYTTPNYNLTVPRPDDTAAYANTDVPASVTITTNEATIIFWPNHQVVDGAGSAITTAVIQLSGEINRQITIYGGSGYVQAG